MNWYIGQRIVAIKNHAQGMFEKGDEFEIKGLSLSGCGCKDVLIFVGLYADETSSSTEVVCSWCSEWFDTNDYKYWFSERNFAPLNEKPELSKFTNETIIESIEPVYI